MFWLLLKSCCTNAHADTTAQVPSRIINGTDPNRYELQHASIAPHPFKHKYTTLVAFSFPVTLRKYASKINATPHVPVMLASDMMC